MKMTLLEAEAMLNNSPKPAKPAFVDSVGGDTGRPELGVPWWTGWKASILDGVMGYDPDWIVDVPEGPIGFVSQWICFLEVAGKGHDFAYVNMPSMDAGIAPEGGLMTIGDLRIFADDPPQRSEQVIEAGYHKVMELVASEQSKAA